MNTPAFTVLRKAATVVEADMLISALRSAGLHPSDLNTSGHIGIGGAEHFYRVEVPTNELADAQEFLRSYEAQ